MWLWLPRLLPDPLLLPLLWLLQPPVTATSGRRSATSGRGRDARGGDGAATPAGGQPRRRRGGASAAATAATDAATANTSIALTGGESPHRPASWGGVTVDAAGSDAPGVAPDTGVTAGMRAVTTGGDGSGVATDGVSGVVIDGSTAPPRDETRGGIPGGGVLGVAPTEASEEATDESPPGDVHDAPQHVPPRRMTGGITASVTSEPSAAVATEWVRL